MIIGSLFHQGSQNISLKKCDNFLKVYECQTSFSSIQHVN